ncbi:MAG: folylpolyglutamate synthase/dihydrofolate synthase family protein [Dermatophilaceae bacterium]
MTPSGRPDEAQREAARLLDLHKKMREVEAAILARTPEHDLEPSLDRIQAVMELLGDPQRTFPSIHITGTNGKTSTARIIEAILRETGLKTGRFTSPHLHSIRERISIAGESIGEEAFIRAYEEVLPYVEMVDARFAETDDPQMSYFEVVVAVAYAAFADAPIDIAIVEVGMGGSWDATNVIDADVAVITPIDVDHARFLGTTPEQIASEKVGIIKPGAVVVSAVQPHDDVAELIRARCGEVDARLVTEGLDFGVLTREVAVGGQLISLRGLAGDYEEMVLELWGQHQAQNAAVAVAAVEAFLGGGTQQINAEVLTAALAAVESPGRLEIVRRSPTVLVDAAHNPHGIIALREAMSDSFNFTRLIGVVAIFADKDAATMLELLEPALDHIVVTRTASTRAMPPEKLGEIAAEIFGDHRVTVVRDLPDALDVAAGLADDGGVGGGVLATGSVFTAAEVRMLLGVTKV